jgi:hypothetical protein
MLLVVAIIPLHLLVSLVAFPFLAVFLFPFLAWRELLYFLAVLLNVLAC